MRRGKKELLDSPSPGSRRGDFHPFSVIPHVLPRVARTGTWENEAFCLVQEQQDTDQDHDLTAGEVHILAFRTFLFFP